MGKTIRKIKFKMIQKYFAKNYLNICLILRSRRGSKENILDSNSTTEEAGLETGLLPVNKTEVKEEEATSPGAATEISYFLRVSFSPEFLEKKILGHPGVQVENTLHCPGVTEIFTRMMQEAAVRGVAVAGVGRVPRAYIALKPGFSLPGEELATWLNSRLEWRHRWGAEGKTSKKV